MAPASADPEIHQVLLHAFEGVWGGLELSSFDVEAGSRGLLVVDGAKNVANIWQQPPPISALAKQLTSRRHNSPAPLFIMYARSCSIVRNQEFPLNRAVECRQAAVTKIALGRNGY